MMSLLTAVNTTVARRGFSTSHAHLLSDILGASHTSPSSTATKLRRLRELAAAAKAEGESSAVGAATAAGTAAGGLEGHGATTATPGDGANAAAATVGPAPAPAPAVRAAFAAVAVEAAATARATTAVRCALAHKLRAARAAVAASGPPVRVGGRGGGGGGRGGGVGSEGRSKYEARAIGSVFASGCHSLERLATLVGLPVVAAPELGAAGGVDAGGGVDAFKAFYERHVRVYDADERFFNVLRVAAEMERKPRESLSPKRGGIGVAVGKAPTYARPTVPRAVVARVVERLISSRGSPLYMDNMDVAVECVLYRVNAHPHTERYSARELRDAGLAQSLLNYESCGIFAGTLGGLDAARFGGLLMDWNDALEGAAPRSPETSTGGDDGDSLSMGGGGGDAAASDDGGWTSDSSAGNESVVSTAEPSVPGLDGDDAAALQTTTVGDTGEAELRAMFGDAYDPPGMSGVDSDSELGGDVDEGVPLAVSGDANGIGDDANGAVSKGVDDGDTNGSGYRASFPPVTQPPPPSSPIESPSASPSRSVVSRLPPLEEDSISAGALHAFCASKSLLTPRAIAAVVRAYGHSATRRLSVTAFARLFLALTDCGDQGAVGFWFPIVDHDGDGVLGLGDVTHFYKQKRVIGMREEGGVVLACVRDVWTRLVGMTAGAASSGEGCGGIGGGGVGGGARRRTSGMSMRDFRLLTPKEREFILCALLVRRVDDAAIVNVRATMLAGGGEAGGRLAAM